MGLTRRQFLKTTGLTAGMLSLSSFTPTDANAGLLAPREHSLEGLRLHSLCGLCKAKCLVDGVFQDGRLLRIEGNPSSSVTGGKLCARGMAAVKMLYDPDRLKYPLKRVGERGEGKWARISWGEAIDTIFGQIEKTLARSGPKALALFSGGPSSRYINELFFDLGCRQVNSSSQELCTTNRVLAYGQTFGRGTVDETTGVFDRARCIVLIGSHLGENVQVPTLRSFSKARSLGAKLVVVDPRVSTVASKADLHLMIRPGTDTALLLGWLKYIVEGRLYNQAYVQSKISDLGRLQDQLRDYQLQDIARICDIELSALKRSTELIAENAPESVIYPGQFSGWYGNDVQRLRAQAILSAILGDDRALEQDIIRPAVAPSTPSARQDSLSSVLVRKILANEIGVVGCWGQNPFHSSVNSYRVQSAFQKAGFVFSCDIYPTETSLYSDIILPEATFMERSDGVEFLNVDGVKAVAVKQVMVEPRFEAKDPYWIVKQLSSRLGKGENFYHDSVDDRTQAELKQLGGSPLDLKKQGFTLLGQGLESPPPAAAESAPPLRPPIVLFSQEIQDQGGAPLPLFEPVQLPPPGYTRLISGRSSVHSSGATVNVGWLKEECPEPELWLNQAVAAKLNIHSGDYLFLENQDGIRSVNPIRIKVTPGIRVDTVYLPHGFGCRSPFMTKAFNVGIADASLLTRSVPDALSGVRGIRVNFVRFLRDGQPLLIPALDDPPEVLKQYQKWWLNSFGSYEKGSQRKFYV